MLTNILKIYGFMCIMAYGLSAYTYPNQTKQKNDATFNTNKQNSLILPNGNFSSNGTYWSNSGFLFKNGKHAYLNVNSTEILTMSNQIHCANPEIKTFSFDYGWNNGTSGGNGTHNTIAALDVHIDGVRYLYISTPRDGGANTDNAKDQGGDALVKAYNGATFTISNPSSQGSQYIDHSPYFNWKFTTITIQLPENAVTKGKIQFYGRANADDFAIDNVRFDLPGNTCALDLSAPEITSMASNSSDNVTTENHKPTISGTCEAGLTVTVQVDGKNITPTTQCKPNGTFSMVPTTAIIDGEHNVTATQVGSNGVVSPKSPTDTLTIETNATPDYTIALKVNPASVTKGTTDIAITLIFSENNTGTNTDTVLISIPKDNKLKLTFDSSNTEWKMIETGVQYKFEYIGNGGKYPPHARQKIQLSGVFTTPNGQKGNFPLSASIAEGNGETDFSNNEDTYTISYNGID